MRRTVKFQINARKCEKIVHLFENITREHPAYDEVSLIGTVAVCHYAS